MQWIEGLEHVHGAPHLVVMNSEAMRRSAPFKQLRSVAPERRGARYVELSCADLMSFKECDPQEYLALAEFQPKVSSAHAVYELQLPTVRLLVPAAVLLLGLLGSMWHLGPWLTSAATLDRLAVPTFDGDKPTVTFFPGSISGGRDKAGTQERFLWLTSFPSARQAWSSVAAHARQGRLAIDLPNACINGSARGLSRGGTLLVTRLHVNEIHPSEAPRAGASLLTGRTFQVSPRAELAAKISCVRLKDDALPPRAEGWHLSDKEWTAVSQLLDIRSVATARPRIDEILIKLGSGRAWDDINRKGDARAYYLRLRRQGRWEQIRQLVVGLRQQGFPLPYAG